MGPGNIGGIGLMFDISGIDAYYAGGGGGSGDGSPSGGSGGIGGAGGGGNGGGKVGANGLPNTGGGGGGGWNYGDGSGGAGGSGIVIIKIKNDPECPGVAKRFAAVAVCSIEVSKASISGLQLAAQDTVRARCNASQSIQASFSTPVLVLSFLNPIVVQDVFCEVFGLKVGPYSFKSSPADIIIYDKEGNPLASSIVSFPDIFSALGNSSFVMSSVFRNDSTSLAVSFRVGSYDTFIKVISLQGVAFSSYSAPTAGASCSNLKEYGSISVVADVSSGSLTLSFLNSTAVVLNVSDVVCVLPGLKNPIVTSPDTYVSSIFTFDDVGWPIVGEQNIKYPAVFGTAAKEGFLKLSSYLSDASSVNASFAIRVDNLYAPIRTISVSGLLFRAFNSSTGSQCTLFSSLGQLIVSLKFTVGSGSLVISLTSNTTVVPASVFVSCLIGGFANEKSRIASNSVQIAVLDADDAGIAIQQNIQFPEIFDSLGINRISPGIIPSTGSLSTSVFGVSFGRAHWSGSVRSGDSACASSAWVSDSLLTCRVSRGSWGSITTSSVMLNRGSASKLYTYSSVSVSSNNATLPTTAAFPTRVYGSNFGLHSSSMALIFSGTRAEVSLWLSSSSLHHKIPRSFSLHESYILISLCTKVSLSHVLFSNSASLLLHSNRTNIPNSGSHQLLLSGVGFGGLLNTAASRFGLTAAESSSWKSDSAVQSRTNLGVFSPGMPLVLSLSQVSHSLSSAASFDLPHVSQVTSAALSVISISGSNFGQYFAVVSRYANCSVEGIIDPYSDVAICSHSELASLRTSGASITEMGFSVSFENAMRLDDVVVILVSPFDRNFTIMKNKCFGCTSQNSSNFPGVSFSFRVPLSSNHPTIPDFVCPASGSYSFSDGADVFKAFSTSAALGPWVLRVISGTVPLRVAGASFYFKTSSLQVFIGVSTVSSIAWNSDSSAYVGAPGLQTQNGMNSASGWGRNRRVRGQVTQVISLDYCNYSYPFPVITEVVRSSISFGSSLSVSGRHFSNSDPSVFVRVAGTSCAASRWLSDTCVLCVVPRATGRIISMSASVELSEVAKIENLTLSSVPAHLFVDSMCFPTSGGVQVSIVGKSFGLYDSTVALRASSKFSSAEATFWRHDTSVVTKVPLPIQAVGIILTVSEILNGSITRASTHVARSLSIVSPSALSCMASTGSSHLLVISNGFGNFGSPSHQLQFGNSVTEFSSWISDSSTRCKSARGYKPVFEALLASLQLFVWSSSYLSLPFQSPAANYLNVTLAENITRINGSGFGSFDSVLLNFNSVPAIVDWTSDSSISCHVPISRNVLDIQIDYFGLGSGNNSVVSAVARNIVPNPVFVASPKPIVESLNSVVYIPAPADFRSHVNMYIQGGSSSGWTFPAPDLHSASFLYSEVILVDIAVFNNHTQVYLKDYLPYTLPFVGNISVVDSDGNALDALICFGKLEVASSIPSKSFAVWLQTSIAICSEARISSASILFHYSVLDEMGKTISFTSRSAVFSVQSRPTAILQHSITRASISAGSKNHHGLNVSLSNAGNCSRLVFDYSVNVSCMSNSMLVAGAFYPHGFCDDSQSVISATQLMFGECVLSLQEWTFGVSGDCVISLAVPRYQVAVLLPLTILPGVPRNFTVVGQLVSSLTGGGIIWSSSASGIKCLVLRFRDRCNNSISIGGFSCMLSASLSNHSQYPLLGPSIVDALSNGECSWCSTRTSLPSLLLVKLQLSCSEIREDLDPLLNVTGLGEPAAVRISALPSTNITTAGAPMAPVTFKILDATGAPVSGSSSTVIRVRVLRKSIERCALCLNRL
jgi:hypothetical protein